MRRRRVAWAIVASVLLGCTGADTLLVVDLVTDLHAGAEFDAVVIEVRDLGDGEVLAGAERAVDRSDDGTEGIRVAELSGVGEGARLVAARLLREGAEVGRGRVVAALEGPTVSVTVVVTADCAGVECSDLEGVAQACRGGRCVDARCAPETPEHCPAPECASDAECDPGPLCAEPRCLEGVCTLTVQDTACGGSACDRTGGCLTVTVEDLFSTGIGADGEVLVEGELDPHWEARADDGPWTDAMVERGNLCSSCDPPGWNFLPGPQDVTEDAPLQHPDHVRTAGSSGIVFSWRTSFTLPAGADPSRVSLSGFVGYDDESIDPSGALDPEGYYVWVNGTPVYQPCAGEAEGTSDCALLIPAGSPFVAGTNELEWRIENVATYYGFRARGLELTYESPSSG